MPKNLSLEGCVGCRLMEMAVKDIPGTCTKAGTGLFSIALEKKTCISSTTVPDSNSPKHKCLDPSTSLANKTYSCLLVRGRVRRRAGSGASMGRGAARAVKKRESCGEEDKSH